MAQLCKLLLLAGDRNTDYWVSVRSVNYLVFGALLALLAHGSLISAAAQDNCILTFLSSQSLFGRSAKQLSCRVTSTGKSEIGFITKRGIFRTINWKQFQKVARRGKGSLRTSSNKNIKRTFTDSRNICASQQSGTSFSIDFEVGEHCPFGNAEIPPPTASPLPTEAPPIQSPTPSASPSPTPSPTPASQIAVSNSSLNFGSVGLGETTHHSIIVRPMEGNPEIIEINSENGNGISLLDNAEVLQRGGVPCIGELTQFCVLMLRLNAESLGNKTLAVTIKFKDGGIPNEDDAPIGQFDILATGTVQSEPVHSTSQFTSISLKALAQAAGKSPPTYLQSEFDRMAPPSYDSSDPFLFDTYNSNGNSQWKSNWSNSAFDFSGVAWDRHMAGTAITRCHIVYARHYPRSGAIHFTKKDGTIFNSTITGTVPFPNPSNLAYDVIVARINPCLPPDWTIYPVIDAADGFINSDLTGSPYINTHYKISDTIRRISVTKVGILYPTGIAIIGAFNSLIPSFMQVMAEIGDSGNPSFFLVEGKLVLASTFTQGGYGGAGPFYGSAIHQQLLRDAIAALP